MSTLQHERIAALAGDLRLVALPDLYGAIAQDAASRKDTSYADFLEAVLRAEREARRVRSREMLTRTAGFPAIKTLEAYDFAFATGAPRTQIQELASLSFLERADDEKNRLLTTELFHEAEEVVEVEFVLVVLLHDEPHVGRSFLEVQHGVQGFHEHLELVGTDGATAVVVHEAEKMLVLLALEEANHFFRSESCNFLKLVAKPDELPRVDVPAAVLVKFVVHARNFFNGRRIGARRNEVKDGFEANLSEAAYVHEGEGSLKALLVAYRRDVVRHDSHERGTDLLQRTSQLKAIPHTHNTISSGQPVNTWSSVNALIYTHFGAAELTDRSSAVDGNQSSRPEASAARTDCCGPDCGGRAAFAKASL